MLPASRSGKTSTLARPATSPGSFSFLAATAGDSAASPCSSPSIFEMRRLGLWQMRSAYDDLVGIRVAAAALGWKRTAARHAVSSPRKQRSAGGRCDGNVGEFRCIRLDVDAAIGKNRQAVRPLHQEETGGRVDLLSAGPMVISAASMTRAVGLAAPASMAWPRPQQPQHPHGKVACATTVWPMHHSSSRAWHEG